MHDYIIWYFEWKNQRVHIMHEVLYVCMVIELWLGNIERRSTLDTFLSKKTICLFNVLIEALNFIEV